MINPPIYSESKGNKLLGLEIIRFISAFSILIWHYQYFFYLADKPINFNLENQPLYALFSLFYRYGDWGVKVFWCISGFIFFYKYRALIADKMVGAKKFFILRFSRLYPLHAVTLFLVLLLQFVYFSQHQDYFVYQNNDLPNFALQIFLASDWFPLFGNSFNGPIWSISVEVLVYFLFFLTIKFFGKSALVPMVIILICIAARSAKINYPLLECITFFYVGGLSAIAFQFLNGSRYKNMLFMLATVAVVLVPIAAYFANFYRHLYMFLFFYVPILLYFCASKLNVHPTVQRLIEAAGNMTYSSYLIHFPIQLLIVILFTYFDVTIPYYRVEFFTIYMAITLIVSYYVYRYFEMPAQSIIRTKYL